MKWFIEGVCPKCNTKGRKLKKENLRYNLKDISLIEEQDPYFCINDECDVVYFQGKRTFDNSFLIRPTAQKSKDPLATVCFCFGYTRADIDQKRYEEYRTKKEQGCACSIRNPSGKCCAKLFRSLLEEKL